MSQLLNEEIQRMQHLAGVIPTKSLFEKFGKGNFKEILEFLKKEYPGVKKWI